jgi:hypothetical protein
MSDAAKQQIQNIYGGLLHWKLAIWKGINGCTIVALGAIIAGLSNLNWAEMDGQARFLFVCGIALSVLKSLDMLLDQTISRIEPPKS